MSAIHPNDPKATRDSDARLAYTVHPGTGPYLLLVHGFLSSSAQWMLNLDPLSAVCTPVTAELWGHGQSPAPVDVAAYAPDVYVEQFERIRQDLGIATWFVCGYSIGASLTMRYALDYPAHVAGQIFTNSSSALADIEQIQVWQKSAEPGARAIESGGLDAINKIAVHPRRAYRLPKTVYTALVEDAADLSPIGVANTLRATTPYASNRTRIDDNQVATLFCFGERERRFRDLGEWATEHMPNIEVARMAAGHGVNMEAADTFNQRVSEFIARHNTAAQP